METVSVMWNNGGAGMLWRKEPVALGTSKRQCRYVQMAYQSTHPAALTCQRALQCAQGASWQHLALGVLHSWAVVPDPGWLLVLQSAGSFCPVYNAAETLEQFCKGSHECVNGLAVCFTVALLSLP